jgi:hypothetical protein
VGRRRPSASQVIHQRLPARTGVAPAGWRDRRTLGTSRNDAAWVLDVREHLHHVFAGGVPLRSPRRQLREHDWHGESSSCLHPWRARLNGLRRRPTGIARSQRLRSLLIFTRAAARPAVRGRPSRQGAAPRDRLGAASRRTYVRIEPASSCPESPRSCREWPSCPAR